MKMFPTQQVNKARLLVIGLAGLLIINVFTLGLASWTNMSRPFAGAVGNSINSQPTPPVTPPQAAIAPTPSVKLPVVSVAPLKTPSTTAGASSPTADRLQEAFLSLKPLLAQAKEALAQIPLPELPPAAPDTETSPVEAQPDVGPAVPAPTEKSNPPLLRLVNPSDTGGDVHYAMDGATFSLRPGEYHEFPQGAARQVEFHRGDDFGYAKLELLEGIYEFGVGDAGWNLTPAMGDFSSHLRRAN